MVYRTVVIFGPSDRLLEWVWTERRANHFLSRPLLFLSSSVGPKAKKTKQKRERARFSKDSRTNFDQIQFRRAKTSANHWRPVISHPKRSRTLRRKIIETYLGFSIISRTELMSTVGVTRILSISNPTSLARTTWEFLAWSENDWIYSFYLNIPFCTQYFPSNQLIFKGVFTSSWHFRHITKRLLAYSQKFPWEKAGLWLFSSIFGGWFFVLRLLNNLKNVFIMVCERNVRQDYFIRLIE